MKKSFPIWLPADLILVGCREERGARRSRNIINGPDCIRQQFYRLFHWHSDLQIADVGNIRAGANLADSYAALRTVVSELTALGKTVIILGGSHDLSLAQYQSYVNRKKLIEVACVDALIDINIDSPLRSDNFLMEMLTDEPNYIHHYNHIAFQSYYVHPQHAGNDGQTPLRLFPRGQGEGTYRGDGAGTAQFQYAEFRYRGDRPSLCALQPAIAQWAFR